MAGSGKDNIHMIKQEVPKFIREFRERTNQASPPTLDSKKPSSKESGEDEDLLHNSDEAPSICVDKSVSAEEAYKFTKEVYGEEVCEKRILNTKRKHEEYTDHTESGKLLFKKPLKEKKEKKEKLTKIPKVKNPTLLSFGLDDEEEDT